jgi:2,4-dienoyl-CoA reductase-like NADH-dependent reductase (Old Yellow Enzyme family)
LSCIDWVEGGWTLEETVKLSKILKQKGVDVIDCSSGGQSPLQKIVAGPGFQVPFAAEVKKSAEILTAAVGMITQPSQAEQIVAKNEADFVLLAREFLRDPHWPLRAAKELGVSVDYAFQYERGKF